MVSPIVSKTNKFDFQSSNTCILKLKLMLSQYYGVEILGWELEPLLVGKYII
jgi:hypothetical protein